MKKPNRKNIILIPIIIISALLLLSPFEPKSSAKDHTEDTSAVTETAETSADDFENRTVYDTPTERNIVSAKPAQETMLLQ